MNNLEEDKVYVLSQGLCTCRVCAPTKMSKEEVERLTNLECPTGISSKWIIPDKYHEEQAKPVTCKDDSSRTHYILYC